MHKDESIIVGIYYDFFFVKLNNNTNLNINNKTEITLLIKI